MTGFSLDDSDHGTVFRDVIMLALAGFVALVVLMLPHLNPPAKDAQAAINAPGNVIVEIRWPDDHDADVDLWVQAPGDVPVGYSNKGGVIFNLLRDDLGQRADATGLNYEFSFSRGIVPGEYTVNLHLYRNASGVLPVPVKVVTSTKRTADTRAEQILLSEVDLRREGEEVTVYRFKLDGKGALVPGSVHSVKKALRTAGKS